MKGVGRRLQVAQAKNGKNTHSTSKQQAFSSFVLVQRNHLQLRQKALPRYRCGLQNVVFGTRSVVEPLKFHETHRLDDVGCRNPAIHRRFWSWVTHVLPPEPRGMQQLDLKCIQF